jgi:hypothetical protein
MHGDEELRPSVVQCKEYNIKTPAEIYPQYYILKVKQFDDKAKNKLDEWIYFFKHNSVKDEFTAKGLDKVRKTLLYENLTPEEKDEYNEMLDFRRQNRSQLSTARDEGKEEARQEYEPIIAEKEAAIAEKEAAIAREREEKEIALAREREKEAALAEKEAALASALAELAALKQNNNQVN